MKLRRPGWRVGVVLVAVLAAFCLYAASAIHRNRLSQQLIAAIAAKDTRRALSLIEMGADPNARAIPGEQRSWFQEWLDLFRSRRGQGQPKGPSALRMAMENEQLDVAKALLRRGATVINETNEFGWPLFIDIAGSKDAELVRMCIERDASVNASTFDGLTPLMSAAISGDFASVKLLVESGADVNARNVVQATALHAAAEHADLPTVQYLAQRTNDIACRCGRGATIIAAAENPRPQVLKYLLQSGLDVNETTRWGMTPLARAISRGNRQNVQMLLARGARVSRKDRGSLEHAVSMGTLNDVRLLLERGANPNTWNNTQWTPLYEAVTTGASKKVALLIKYGANVNAKNKVGMTPLSLAKDYNQPEIAWMLIAAGAHR